VQGAQVCEPGQFLQPRVPNCRVGEVQFLQAAEPGKLLQPGVRNGGAGKAQFLQAVEPGKLLQPGVRNGGAVENQKLQCLEPGVRNRGALQTQLFQAFEPGQHLQTLVRYVRVGVKVQTDNRLPRCVGVALDGSSHLFDGDLRVDVHVALPHSSEHEQGKEDC